MTKANISETKFRALLRQWLYLILSPPDFDGWGRWAKKEEEGTKVWGIHGEHDGGRAGCARRGPTFRRCWSLLPWVAPGILCESLCALFELSQALCFPVTLMGPGFLRVRGIYLPSSGLLFFLHKPLILLSSFSFCSLSSLLFPMSSPYPATFHGRVNHFFFFSSLSILHSVWAYDLF